MNMIPRIISILCQLALFGIGAVQFVRFMLERFWKTSAAHTYVEAKMTIFNHPVTIAGWWALVAFMPLCLLAIHLWNVSRGKSRTLTLKSASGNPLNIREAAINRFLHDDLLLLPFVKSVKIASRAPGGSVSVEACVWITSAGPLDNLQIQLLDRIRGALQTGLGISQVSAIDLQFESVQLTRAQIKNRSALANPSTETALEPLPLSEPEPYVVPQTEEKIELEEKEEKI
jgi:hypothetical protein